MVSCRVILGAYSVFVTAALAQTDYVWVGLIGVIVSVAWGLVDLGRSWEKRRRGGG